VLKTFNQFVDSYIVEKKMSRVDNIEFTKLTPEKKHIYAEVAFRIRLTEFVRLPSRRR
jgi:hypothetical protein